MPSYTFTENGMRGTIEVVKSGVSSAPISVRVVGGEFTHKLLGTFKKRPKDMKQQLLMK